MNHGACHRRRGSSSCYGHRTLTQSSPVLPTEGKDGGGPSLTVSQERCSSPGISPGSPALSRGHSTKRPKLLPHASWPQCGLGPPASKSSGRPGKCRFLGLSSEPQVGPNPETNMCTFHKSPRLRSASEAKQARRAGCASPAPARAALGRPRCAAGAEGGATWTWETVKGQGVPPHAQDSQGCAQGRRTGKEAPAGRTHHLGAEG